MHFNFQCSFNSQLSRQTELHAQNTDAKKQPLKWKTTLD